MGEELRERSSWSDPRWSGVHLGAFGKEPLRKASPRRWPSWLTSKSVKPNPHRILVWVASSKMNDWPERAPNSCKRQPKRVLSVRTRWDPAEFDPQVCGS